MKVTLDLDQLLAEGKITQTEYDKLFELSAKSTSSLAFNMLIAFGVIAVSGAALALVPTPATAVVIGLLILAAGMTSFGNRIHQWKVLSSICILVGVLMAGGGTIAAFKGSMVSILSVTLIFAAASIYTKSAMLAVLATLTFSISIGARSGYSFASYFFFVENPTVTIVLFSALATGLYQLSKKLSAEYERIAIASARTGVCLVNVGFWAGSLWGARSATGEVIISDTFFAILWALALLATAAWSWNNNRRWVLNTVATFGGIHFFTQWFVSLGASPGTVLAGGLLALGFAVGLRTLNSKMKEDI